MNKLPIPRLAALALFSALAAAPLAEAASPAWERRSPCRYEECDACYARRHALGHKALMYFPNRIFDVLDLVRCRLRIGPGVAAGARVTALTDVFLGSYVSVYAGLPGPRQAPILPLPVGLESRSGVAVSVVDATASICRTDPRYSLTESGAGVHIIIAGVELGVDPFEAVDLLVGFAMADLADDDL